MLNSSITRADMVNEWNEHIFFLQQFQAMTLNNKILIDFSC